MVPWMRKLVNKKKKQQAAKKIGVVKKLLQLLEMKNNQDFVSAPSEEEGTSGFDTSSVLCFSEPEKDRSNNSLLIADASTGSLTYGHSESDEKSSEDEMKC